jgi:hypothetical protein
MALVTVMESPRVAAAFHAKTNSASGPLCLELAGLSK